MSNVSLMQQSHWRGEKLIVADLARAKKLLEKLSSGSDVSLRDLESALGKEGVEEYNHRWQAELGMRELFKDKPEEIKQYEEMLHDADFLYNRAEGIKKIGKRSKTDVYGRNSRQRLYGDAEKKYEAAAEYLGEIVSADPNLQIWFDRTTSFDPAASTNSIDPIGMPRTVTSRSQHKLTGGMAAQYSKTEVKRSLLEDAFNRVKEAGTNGVQLDEAQQDLLKSKLAKLKKNSGNIG